MDTNSHENGNDVNKSSSFLAGLMVGGLASADDFLPKPVQPAELVMRVQSALRLRRMGEELRAQTGESPVEALTQIRTKARQTATNLRKKAEALQQRRGQDMPDEIEVMSHESQTLE